MSLHRCDNCHATTFNPKPVRDYDERVDSKHAPSGECPLCGALVYPVTTTHIPLQTFLTMATLSYGVFSKNAGELVDFSGDEESGDMYISWEHDNQEYSAKFNVEDQVEDGEGRKIVHVEDGTMFWLNDDDGDAHCLRVLQPIRIFA